MKIFITIIVIALVIGGWIWYSQNNTPSYTPQTENTTSTAPQQPQPTQAPQTATITYTDAGFSRASITVALHGTVTFKNNSSRPFWPASSMHPSHEDYPQHTGMCKAIGGSDFDACGPVAPGKSWSFKFDYAGTWNYHDHLSARQYGQIIVK